jgi:cell division protein FtsB
MEQQQSNKEEKKVYAENARLKKRIKELEEQVASLKKFIGE